MEYTIESEIIDKTKIQEKEEVSPSLKKIYQDEQNKEEEIQDKKSAKDIPTYNEEEIMTGDVKITQKEEEYSRKERILTLEGWDIIEEWVNFYEESDKGESHDDLTQEKAISENEESLNDENIVPWESYDSKNKNSKSETHILEKENLEDSLKTPLKNLNNGIEMEKKKESIKQCNSNEKMEKTVEIHKEIQQNEAKEENQLNKIEKASHQEDQESIPEELKTPKIHLTYQQRKRLQYEKEVLASFGGGLGDMVIKPKLSQIEIDKRALQELKNSQNIVVNRRRKLGIFLKT